MKYEVNYGNGVVVLPKSVTDKLASVGEAELKFLIRILADEELLNDYEANADNVAGELKLSRAELDSALAYWRGADIISASAKKGTRKVARHATIPSYTGEELSRIIDENGLAMIIDECQHILGKVFNVTEVNRIAALNSYLGLDPEYILLLFSYCQSKDKASLKYIEKLAYDLSDNGINTPEKLEIYIKNEEERKSLEGRLRILFGWGERSLTPAEKKHIQQWNGEYGYGEDIIREAYNITVEKTGKLSLPYLAKILANWHDKGYKTLDEIHSAIDSYTKEKEIKNQENTASFDVDEFFELALKRSKEKMLNN